MEVIQWPIEGLRPHPKNEEIYGAVDPGDLVASIRDNGILSPLHITAGGVIICGHRRHAGATIVGLEDVPVLVSTLTDEIDILNLLLQDNAHSRVKTKKQLAMEVRALQEVERVLAARRRAEGNRLGGLGGKSSSAPTTTSEEAGDVRTIVAERAGVGRHSSDLLGHLATIVPTLPQEQQDIIWEVAETRGVLPAIAITPGLEHKARIYANSDARLKGETSAQDLPEPLPAPSFAPDEAGGKESGKRWYDRLGDVARALDALDGAPGKNKRQLVKTWGRDGLRFNRHALTVNIERLSVWLRFMDAEIESRKEQGKW